jgi:hypothetical protein
VELPGASQCGGPSSLAGTHEQAVHFTEIYRFDVGYQDILRWTIRKLGRGVYRGAEARSVGEAVGEQAGCAFEMIDLSALRPYPKMRDAFSRADKADREEHWGFWLHQPNPGQWRIGDPAGLERTAAALLIGMKQVPIVRLSDLGPADREAYVLADNKLALNGGWDRDVLAIELPGLIDLGFDLRRPGLP